MERVKWVIINDKERADWMNERMAKGYSFVYGKDIYPVWDEDEGKYIEQKINSKVKCVDTGEVFEYIRQPEKIL
jgi:hypothetical protein